MPAWLPDRGLIRIHHDYGVWCTDAPPIYHVASMLTTMASVCADTALLIIRNKPYPLHVWTMLVGRSTSDRKTTSTQLAIARVEKDYNHKIKQIYGSPEAAIKELEATPCAAIYVPEGQAFFEQQGTSYWKHARGLFMDLYDYKTKFERKLVKDTVTVKDPRVSILAACARPILERHTRDSDWLSGFLARFLMISGQPLAFKASPQTNAIAETQIEQMIQNLYLTQWGTMGCTTGAIQILEDFAREIHHGLDQFPEGIHPSLNRLPETAKRLAGLYELAFHVQAKPTTGMVVVVTPEAAELAVNLCRASRDEALIALAPLVTAPGHARDVSDVDQKIFEAGPDGATRQGLLRSVRKLRAEDLDRVIKRLLEEGVIRLEVRRGTTGRPANVYVHNLVAQILQNQALSASPKVPRCWIPLDPTLGNPDISALPAFDLRALPPGVAFDPEAPEDEDSWN